MAGYYDDNFGAWDGDDNFGAWDGMGDPNMRDFYNRVQHESVVKTCVDCGQKVKIRREYECCNSCATRREGGGW